MREEARQAPHHRVGPAVVRRSLKPCELDRTADPVARIEGSGDEALALEHDRTVQAECPLWIGGVVASLRIERNAIAELLSKGT
jgi:hypothetical protein